MPVRFVQAMISTDYGDSKVGKIHIIAKPRNRHHLFLTRCGRSISGYELPNFTPETGSICCLCQKSNNRQGQAPDEFDVEPGESNRAAKVALEKDAFRVDCFNCDEPTPIRDLIYGYCQPCWDAERKAEDDEVLYIAVDQGEGKDQQ